MSQEAEHRAAEYVLGLLHPEERVAVERAAVSDSVLADEIRFWNERLAPLLDTAEVKPPPDLFARVEAEIAARAKTLPDTLTIRTDEGRWERLVDGVERKILASPVSGRVTFLIRGRPGARFPGHPHAQDEECFVLEGDITFETLTLRAGDYHLVRRGTPHPPATTAGGCLLLMTAAAA
jgi:anti-sigma factor ChrR (cupin superfamily)